MERKFEIIIDKQTGAEKLLMNGNPCICPFQTKLLVPGNIAGTVGLQEYQCTSNCQFFEYNANEKTLGLRCSGVTYDPVEIKDETKVLLFNNNKAFA